ncbi:MAG: hypothetical protein CL917_17410 [Deltaproteobacteria bacterium]|nr:hypothetical protein [Deltaproteobacteria bacterium]
MNEEATLTLLLEQHAVIDVLSRYARGIDRRDKKLYRACLCDQIDIDIEGMEERSRSADEWITEAFSISDNYASTQHLITNHEVHFKDGPNGNIARCTAHLQAQQWNPQKSTLLGGRYDYGLRKEGGEWRIDRIGLKVDWVEESSE